jgi:signal transduction histidine kinase
LKQISYIIIGTICLTLFSCSKKEKRVNIFSFSSEKYKNSTPHKKIYFLDSIYSTHNNYRNDSLSRSFLFDLSAEYYYLNDYENSLKVNEEISILSKQSKDNFSLARSYYYIGDCYLLDNKDSSYHYYYKAEKLYRKLNVKEKLALVLFKKALLLMYEGNYLESEIQISKSLILLKYTKNYQLLFSSYSTLGADFEKLEEYDNALKYYLLSKKVLNILQKENLDFDSQYNYNLSTSINLSNAYQKLGEYKKAIQELLPLNNDEIKEKWPKEYAIILSNLGNAKMQIGDLQQANVLFFKSLEVSIKNNFEDNIIYEYINIGECYFKLNVLQQSKYYLKEALKLAQKIKATDEIKTILRLLVKVDASNQYLYDEKYITISDSLAKAQRKSREKYARIEYETSVVEDENKILSTKNTYILIAAFISIFALVLIIVKRYIKSQKREIEYRIAQQKAEEEVFNLLKEYQLKLSIAKELEQNRISKELHDSVLNKLYGARMQLGILNDSNISEVKEKRLIYVDLLQEIEQEIRAISHELNTDIIDNQIDFISLLSNSIQLQNDIGKTIFSFEVDCKIDWGEIDSLIKITIFRIIQESLMNVTKHADASTCKVSISLDANIIILQIKDDGVGFDIKAKSSGIGIKNIKERLSILKSKYKIMSTENTGTSIQIFLHLNKK